MSTHELPPLLAFHLDPEVCERARQTRDARFDGRFFIAVTSTKIYCRPVCPVQPPLAKNVRFYATAAAAEAAGFRPCLRCRPETAPGTPAWAGTGATVARALRLIDEGALDEGSLEVLATRLGVGERYLRKLFEAQVGASPSAVAKTRRLHLAKRLLDETALSMPAIAEAAGFGSLRRFNAAFQESYGRTPGSLRRKALSSEIVPDAGVCRLRLPYREPWRWEQFHGHFALRALPGVEVLEPRRYARSFRLAGHCGWYAVRPLDGEPVLELTVSASALPVLAQVVARVRRQFDLDAEPGVIAGQLAADPALAPLLAATPGLRLPCAFDAFEQAVRAIVGQQVTVKAAVTVVGRLVDRYGEVLEAAPEGAPTRLFPRPEALAQAELAGIGMPGKRAEALRGFAARVADASLVLAADQGVERLVAELRALPGLGPWTAEYIALRAFGEPDAFPASDLGLLKSRAWGENPPTAGQLQARAEAWRPWRAYAAVYLWNSYEI
ncbi:MAG: helix-turn-helix domain-containing protein [Gammaproteobacteria bacterium]|nr:helix-turn-helix domain-containing protein [Gammaproteobacteria bacterium]